MAEGGGAKEEEGGAAFFGGGGVVVEPDQGEGGQAVGQEDEPDVGPAPEPPVPDQQTATVEDGLGGHRHYRAPDRDDDAVGHPKKMDQAMGPGCPKAFISLLLRAVLLLQDADPDVSVDHPRVRDRSTPGYI